MNATLKQHKGELHAFHDIHLAHTNTRKRMKRNVSKKVRRSERTEIEQAVDEIMESRRDTIERERIESEELMEDLFWIEASRQAYEDERIHRWSEEDYPQASGLYPEDMDTDEYRHYSFENEIWD